MNEVGFTAETQRTRRLRREVPFSAPPLRPLRLCGELLFALILSISCVAPLAAAALPAHKFYASLAQVEHNSQTKSLEVAIRVFADDLELALTKRARRAVYLDTTPDVAKLIRDYLQERFEVRGRDGKIKELKWIGMEPKVDSAWLYVEIPVGESTDGIGLRNRILLDLYPEQVNTTIFKAASEQNTFIFKNGDDAWRGIKETMK